MIQQLLEYDPTKMRYPVYGQVKMDGIFGRWERSELCIYTRSGNIIKGLSVIEAELSDRVFLPLDGELVIPGLDFFTMNGKIRSSEETPDCMFYVFDVCVTPDEYEKRVRIYQSLVSPDMPHVQMMKTHLINNEREADAFYEKVIKAGFEGVVYKQLDAAYADGKHWHAVKRVPLKSVECKIVSAYEGKGKLAGMLGGFVVEFNNQLVKVGGGPGVDYAKRKEMWENKDKYIGEQLKCVYKSLTPNGSMRSPQMLGVRWDN